MKFITIILLVFFISQEFSCQHIAIEKRKYYKVVDTAAVTLWYNQPSAVHLEAQHKRTYFAYLNLQKQVIVKFFDFKTREFTGGNVVDSWENLDDHSAPILWIKRYGPAKGKLLILYSYHSTPMYFRTSSKSEDIESWSERRTLDEGRCTYGSLVEDLNGKLHLFYTRQTDRRVLVKRTSTDAGETWSEPVTMLDFGSGTFVYAAPVAISANRLGLVWTIYRDSGDLVGHKDVFVAFSDDGENWTSSGVTSKLLTPENSTPVFRSAPNRESVVWSVAFDKDQSPIAIFIEHAPLTDIGWSDCYAFYLSYDHVSREWRSQKISTVDSNVYPAGAVINPKNPTDVILGGSTLSRWSRARSNTWEMVESISDPLSTTYYNPIIPYGTDVNEIFWMDVRNYLRKEYETKLHYVYSR